MSAPRSYPLAFRAGAAYFGLVFGAGFVLGLIRIPILVPRLGERNAELLEMPIMMGVVFLAARFIVRGFSLPRSPAVRAGAGAWALGLLLSAELLLSVAIQGRSIPDYIASRDPVSGTVYLLSLVLFAAMPSLLLRFDRSAIEDETR